MKISHLAVIVMAIVAMASVVPQHAFATNPYYGGYAKTASIDQIKQVWTDVNFTGSSAPQYYTGGVISTTGVVTNSSSSGIMYQDAVSLNNNMTITADPQMWKVGGTAPSWITSTSLGTQGTALADVAYVYTTFYWTNSLRNQVTYYYQPVYNDGTSGSSYLYYNKASGDNSVNFGVGYQDFTGGTSTYRVKFLQFGVESGDISTGWNVYEYGMGYVSTSSGVQNLSSISSYTSPWINTDTLNDSWIIYTTSGGTVSMNPIGAAQYNVNAHYNKLGTGIPSGTVYWFRGTFLNPGTQLW